MKPTCKYGEHISILDELKKTSLMIAAEHNSSQADPRMTHQNKKDSVSMYSSELHRPPSLMPIYVSSHKKLVTGWEYVHKS